MTLQPGGLWGSIKVHEGPTGGTVANRLGEFPVPQGILEPHLLLITQDFEGGKAETDPGRKLG